LDLFAVGDQVVDLQSSGDPTTIPPLTGNLSIDGSSISTSPDSFISEGGPLSMPQNGDIRRTATFGLGAGRSSSIARS
jgi:hypothetical protein